MRVFMFRWFVCAIIVCTAETGRSQDLTLPGIKLSAANQTAVHPGGEFELRFADGTVREGRYRSVSEYLMPPGWSKPRQIVMGSLLARSGQPSHYRSPGMGGMGGMSSGMGMGSMGELGASVGSAMPGGLLSATEPRLALSDVLHIHALVLDQDAAESRPQIVVGLLDKERTANEHNMMSMGGEGSGGEMGSMGGMQGAKNPFSTYPLVPGQKVILNALDAKPNLSLSPTSPVLSATQIKNLVELISVDCWIGLELAKLRDARKDAEQFRTAENALKELLNQEYALQLSKQKEDVERLTEKLKLLQAELARRATAQERVVEVQLGQLVLEAQGLIGERP